MNEDSSEARKMAGRNRPACIALDLTGNLIELLGGTCREHDAGPLTGETPRDGAADAASCAGDHGHPVL